MVYQPYTADHACVHAQQGGPYVRLRNQVVPTPALLHNRGNMCDWAAVLLSVDENMQTIKFLPS